MGDMQPILWYYKGFVVIKRKGCDNIGGLKFIIIDLNCQLTWYFGENRGF